MIDMQTLKNIRRLNKIAVTLIRYGFGHIASEMRILPFFAVIERIFVSEKTAEGLTTPERIRLVLEELGPTFIKLGQIASTRADLLPPDWIAEFKRLQDMVPSVPFEEVKRVVEASLKAPLEEKFPVFSPEPVASASIAQVHLAELANGDKVAVKVKRPGIAPVIEADISVMETVAGLLERYVPASRRYRPREVVAEFAGVIEKEQDLTLEGGNANRFYNLFKGSPKVQIPRVYWELTTRECLTMERISGTPIDEADKLRERGIDITKAAEDGIELFFKQVFEFGLFHADLHPGNIFVRDDGVIIYLDFGIVGRLDRDLRKYLANMLYYLVKEDYYRMALVHREMGLISEEVSLHEFEEALREITEPIFGKPLEQISISALLMKLIQTARRFDMKLQPNLLLLQKSMVIIEGVGRQLCPEINMWEVAKPLIFKWMVRERWSPKAVFEKGKGRVEELAEAAYELPIHMNNLLLKTFKQDLRIGFDHHKLEPVTEELNSAGRRIAGGLVVSAVVLGASVMAVLADKDGARFLGIPVISAIGFIVAVVIGIKVFGADRR
ncbi:MAG: 2-polyprenylphenol 6-hydroxylase [Deltaproteobacteria bacterium]|nr:2-polyprenylphenol 6-hydroxylase [Deltaproteobacteria bacterium]